MDKSCKLISFNCKSVTRCVDYVRKLCQRADILALQETWLLPHDLQYLNKIDEDFGCTGTSAVDTSAGILRGRPYGGVALLWRKNAFGSVTVLHCASVRLAAIRVITGDTSFLVFSVYMPVDCGENLPEFTECLAEINALLRALMSECFYFRGL
ncbi:unnamed protein product [Leptosia nina]|uniref:Endonuclease/exonuclease/phosphatase domain-containing protein n=1 Tax=Leptosia nina TaxID=320188 RepID=A0AAV1IWF1_9NEOP